MNANAFHDSESSSSEEQEDSSTEDDANQIQHYQWTSIDGKAAKVSIGTNYVDIEELMIKKIKEVKYYVFVKNEQYRVYNELKSDMPENALLVHVDYVESYENKQQDECQSAYSGHTTFSIFTAVIYLRYQGELVKKSMVLVFEAKDHSCIAAHTCIQRVVDEVMVIYGHLQQFESIDLHIYIVF